VLKDLRQSPLYLEAESIYRSARQPGSGLISDAKELSTNGREVTFAGAIVDALEGIPATRVCLTKLATGDTRVLTFGPHTDRAPRFSPAGHCIAFLSDRHQSADFQLYLMNPDTGGVRPARRVDGWVEYLHWSPDGNRILLGVAGHGSDVAGGQGATSTKRVANDLPEWMPQLDSGNEACQWRRIWVYDLAADSLQEVGSCDLNIWEATWCGNKRIAAVASPGPGEGLWYSAHLHIIDVDTSISHEVYRPRDQIGWPAASPSGQHVAFVEGVCSDRGIIAGSLKLLETRSGKISEVKTAGVDVTFAEWRSDECLLLAGHSEFATVVATYRTACAEFQETWRSEELSTSGFFASVSGMNEHGDCVLITEGFLRAPCIAAIRQGCFAPVKSFDVGYEQSDHVKSIGGVQRVEWAAPDGLKMQGWLLMPGNRGPGPYPLIMSVHGGPVWHWHPLWLGRGAPWMLMLVKRGFAVFLPNPRGSSGRGPEFARRVIGDLGGADAADLLSGLDYLVSRDIADPNRLGVMGISYGGFMTAWLISQDARFSAAIPIAPITHQVTEHLVSNIPHFVSLFLGGRFDDPGGKYFQRSPLMFSHRVNTPTLQVCGALDRCTPAIEAVQFHSALRENGVESILVTYPHEGHGVRKWPATCDFAARVVAWFEEHLRRGFSGSP